MFLLGGLFNDLSPIGIMGTAGSEVAVVAVTTDTTTVGAIIDGHGSDRALLTLINKTLTDGDYQWQIFHGDVANMSDEAQVADADINGDIPDWDADTDDDQVVTLELILRKRYFRVKIVSTNTSSGVDAIGGVALLRKLKSPTQTET